MKPTTEPGTKWYIVFDTFVLCKKGTVTPMAFDDTDQCQTYIDQHCPPQEFPEIEFVNSTEPEAVVAYALNKPGKDT